MMICFWFLNHDSWFMKGMIIVISDSDNESWVMVQIHDVWCWLCGGWHRVWVCVISLSLFLLVRKKLEWAQGQAAYICGKLMWHIHVCFAHGSWYLLMIHDSWWWLRQMDREREMVGQLRTVRGFNVQHLLIIELIAFFSLFLICYVSLCLIST